MMHVWRNCCSKGNMQSMRRRITIFAVLLIGLHFLDARKSSYSTIHLASKSIKRSTLINTERKKQFEALNIALPLVESSTLLHLGHIPLENFLEFQFYGIIQVGTPWQNLLVCFDTGSSDFWIPSTQCLQCGGYNRFSLNASSTLVEDPRFSSNFTVTYGSGSASGRTIHDRVSFGGYELKDVKIGIVNYEQLSLSNMQSDGILGMAFDGLSSFSHPPLFDKVLQQHDNIPPVFSFYLTKIPNSPGSKLVLGGFDETLVPKDAQWLSNKVIRFHGKYSFWLLQMNQVQISDSITICDDGCTAMIDTGTSLIGVPPEYFLGILDALSRYTSKFGCYCALTQYGFQCFLCSQKYFPSLRFSIGEGNYFILKGEDYVMCIENTCIPLLQSSLQGMWILGDVFLKKYYSLFDVRNRTVSFACGDPSDCGNDDTYTRTFQTMNSYDDSNLTLVLSISGLSLLGSAFIIASFWHFPSLRKKRVLAMVFWLSVCNFDYNLLIWVAGLFNFPNSEMWCRIQGAIQQFTGLGIVLFSGIISIELLRAVSGYQSETRDFSKYYYCIVLLMCITATIISLGVDVIGQVPDLNGPDMYCFVHRSPSWARIVLFYIPVICTMLTSIYAVYYAIRRLYETNLLQTESGRRSARLLISYVVVFITSYILATVIGIISIFTYMEIPSWLTYINQFCFYSHGLLNCFVWSFSPSFREAYQSKNDALYGKEVEPLLK